MEAGTAFSLKIRDVISKHVHNRQGYKAVRQGCILAYLFRDFDAFSNIERRSGDAKVVRDLLMPS